MRTQGMSIKIRNVGGSEESHCMHQAKPKRVGFKSTGTANSTAKVRMGAADTGICMASVCRTWELLLLRGQGSLSCDKSWR